MYNIIVVPFAAYTAVIRVPMPRELRRVFLLPSRRTVRFYSIACLGRPPPHVDGTDPKNVAEIKSKNIVTL